MYITMSINLLKVSGCNENVKGLPGLKIDIPLKLRAIVSTETAIVKN